MTIYEEQQTIKTNRFLTIRKDKAFNLAQKLNETENMTRKWYVGIRIYNKIVIDIDNHDAENIHRVQWFYSRLYSTEWVTVKTMHGYHLIQKGITPKTEIDLFRCNLLMPGLPKDRLQEYLKAVNSFFQQQKEEHQNEDRTINDLQAHARDMTRLITEAGLNHAVGIIDVLHALIGVQRGYYVLRVSKKSNDEKVIA
jgi:hypothetical protein